MRVLTIGHSYVVGMNRAVARAIAAAGDFDVTVVAPSFFHGDLRQHSVDREPDASPLKVLHIPCRWSRAIHLFQYEWDALSRIIRGGAWDVVHAWEEPYIVAGWQIGRAVLPTAARFVFRTALNLPKHYRWPFSAFEEATRNRAQGWVAGGELVYQNMVSRGYSADAGRVITLAVDTGAFRPLAPSQREDALRELGLRPPVIAYVGRLSAMKGLRVLMQAMAQLPSSLEWSLLLLGSGEMRNEVTGWARSRGWSNRVKIHLAKHEEVPRILPAADLMVLPSQTTPRWREQFGRVIVEAFASGVPVIGSSSGEIPRVIGDAGVVVPEHDVAGWARAIESLLRDEGARKDFIVRGMQRVTNYSTGAIALKWAECYRWLAGQPIHRKLSSLTQLRS